MGFDGKMLIHPAQIEAANHAFGVSEADAAAALLIVAAFGAPENVGKGAINLKGRMVEKLHAEQAERLLAKADWDLSAPESRVPHRRRLAHGERG